MELHWICHACRVALVADNGIRSCPRCGLTVGRRDGYDDVGMPATVGFTEERTRVLAGIEGDHFWFAPRDRLIRRLFSRIAPPAARVMDLGCGTGRFLAGLQPGAAGCAGVEAFEDSVRAAVARRTGADLVRGDVCAVPLADASFDVVVSMDVLEHVDPALFLAEARRLARPGGRLLLSVPADPLLWSEADRVAGHRCRYTLPLIAGELESQGWRLRGYTHYQFLLYPLMVLSRVLFKGKNRVEKHPPAWVNRILGWVNAIEVRLLSGFALPWGSSLIIWAERP